MLERLVIAVEEEFLALEIVLKLCHPVEGRGHLGVPAAPVPMTIALIGTAVLLAVGGLLRRVIPVRGPLTAVVPAAILGGFIALAIRATGTLPGSPESWQDVAYHLFGISFLAIHDGSAFDPVQAVVPSDLANYESEVLHLTTGCAVVVSGELVASQGKGQSVEIQATEVE